MSFSNVLELIAKEKIAFVDLRFTDSRGKEQHMTISSNNVTEALFREGNMFDGSSIAGWKSIHSSDMVLMPDPSTAKMDPFFDNPTLVMTCDVLDPLTMKGYERCPRTVAKKAEAYLLQSGIADTCYFGPEPEFFIFKDARWKIDMDHVFSHVDADEASWNSSKVYEGGNLGHRPKIKGGYFPVPPVDSSQDLRSAICLVLEDLGIKVERQHHEVAPCQQEINIRYANLLKMADDMQVLKYVVHNVAHQFGRTATFMPKPIPGDNGSGMHCHISLSKDGKNLFSGNSYSGLSDTALHFIGGIIKHARALNVFTNPTTNSYKRLVPGFEAPVFLAYSARNRSAAIRIPHVAQPQGARIEVRFPDPAANPYLAFSAMMMAGLDGIERKISPGEPLDQDLFQLSGAEMRNRARVAGTLEEALQGLREDSEFLLAGDVFTKDLLEAYGQLKVQEINRLRTIPHPVEFDMYYSV
jgi:glutamine synthetase